MRCDTVIAWSYEYWRRNWLEIIQKHNQIHKMHADIIQTWAAHGAMRNGAAGAHIGYMPRKILFYICRHNFFSPRDKAWHGFISYSRENTV